MVMEKNQSQSLVSFTNRITSPIKNFFLSGKSATASTRNPLITIPNQETNARAMRYFMAPLQLERLAHDISMWRDAVKEAENPFWPYRVKMQRMFVDTILEGHTFSCIQKRKDLSLLKDFIIQDKNGNVNEEATAIFKDRQWFNNLLNYILDAQFYGYSLIELGDLKTVNKKYDFPNLFNIRRWNVSPDRKNMSSIPYQPQGIMFDDPNELDDNGESFFNWSLYVSTPTDIGHSICGYGLLYNAAIYCIILKNNLGNNADYTQAFSTPYRHAKMPKGLSEDKKVQVDKSLEEMGSLGWIRTDDDVSIEFHESNSGNGYKGYESLEARCEKKISKIILGHSDAMDSTPGKLGGSQGPNEESPAGKALADTEKKQDMFLLNVLNDNVLPKLRVLGFRIGDDLKFGVSRDREELEARKKEDETNKGTADIALVMKNAGLKMDAKYFQDRTGIPTTDAPEPAPTGNMPFNVKNTQMKARLEKIYGNGYHHAEGVI